jgi:predicted dithiol-disulfide oxidoreductase (DUF899 family)
MTGNSLSNWGRWGAEDERSALNLLTPELVRHAATLVKTGKVWLPKGELPGLSVFLREGDRVFHTYSTYQRGLDIFLNTYNFLDVTPLGRQEQDGRFQAWIRHHDRYSA